MILSEATERDGIRKAITNAINGGKKCGNSYKW